jgi:hypothetical protein
MAEDPATAGHDAGGHLAAERAPPIVRRLAFIPAATPVWSAETRLSGTRLSGDMAILFT